MKQQKIRQLHASREYPLHKNEPANFRRLFAALKG
jgi:hypothetical protein